MEIQGGIKKYLKARQAKVDKYLSMDRRILKSYNTELDRLIKKEKKSYSTECRIRDLKESKRRRSKTIRRILEDKKVTKVVVSFQNTKNKELLPLVKKIIKAEEYLLNPAGEWTLGGFDADTGLSGRKLIVDNYGPEFTIGGGSFSGKDVTKVDRSAAYMARRIAVDLLKKNKAKEVFVKLAYAIGKAEPVMASVVIDGVEQEIKNYDLTPAGIRKYLKLDQVKYANTCTWGHFGRGFSWK